MTAKKPKRRRRRKWCYTMRPAVYEISPCDCGNRDIEWSEWEGHCWCAKCKRDFIPKSGGLFDGPIPLKLANMMGIRFDRYDLATKKVIRQEEYLE